MRLIEPNRERAREIAEQIPACRVYNTDGIDPDFLERERIGDAQAAVFAMREDAKNLFAATLARVHGVPFTIAIVHELVAREVYDYAGIDVSDQPAPGDGRGDRALRPRPADAAGRDARGRPLRGARHHDEPRERVRRARRSATCRSAAR